MKSTNFVSHLAAAAVLLAAPVAWAQMGQSGGSAQGSGTMNPAANGSSETMQRHGAAGDTELENRVKQAIQQDANLRTSQITVTARNNVVYLTGKVDTRVERSQAVEVASRVEGVNKVEDKLSVGNNP